MPLPRILIIASWALFFTVWTVLARRTKPTVEKQARPEMWRYMFPLLAGTALLAVPVRPDWPLAPLIWRVLPPSPVVLWSGAMAAMTGALLAVWARLVLGRNWSGDITVKAEHALVTDGPYASIRHPIYTALILLYLALALAIGTTSALAGLTLVIWSCWVKLQYEEALMRRIFPDSYPAYMARSKRLVPFLV